MRLTASLAVAACLLTAADDPAKGKNDPQASHEPRSGPGAGQAFLEKFAGDWDVKKAFFLRSGAAARAEGTCRQTMVHDGRFLQSDFVFRQGAVASTGRGVTGFEPESGRFTSVWIDSRQTRMSFRQSRDPFDGKSLVLYSRSLEPDATDARRSKTVTTLEDDGRKVVHRQYALAADGGERLMMELILTRKPAPPAPAR